MNILLPIGAGLVVGFLIGLTGMGGGALMTPFLLIFMKLNPVLAVGTDLTFAAVTKIVGSIQHRRENNVSIRRVAWMAAGSLPASYLAAQFILHQGEDSSFVSQTLPKFLGWMLIVVSLIILARITRLVGPKEHIEIRWPSPIAMVFIGALGGALVGLTSIGGGTVIMALLLVFFSIPLNQMVGMDVLHGALLATVPAVTYAFAGKVNWGLVGPMLIGSLPGAWLGARTVNKIDRRIVRAVLGLLILGAGIHVLLQ
ncbi:MAG: sulfite exporter TauE/SafE family protein [Anaerolineales bacterium]|nr:sulfite exporter TauE/SafE family protein [Anaerolineales bacterium]